MLDGEFLSDPNAQRLQVELSHVMGRARDKEQFWRCPECGSRNALSRSSCIKCGVTLRGELLAKPTRITRHAWKRDRIEELIAVLFIAQVVAAVLLRVQAGWWPQLSHSLPAYGVFHLTWLFLTGVFIVAMVIFFIFAIGLIAHHRWARNLGCVIGLLFAALTFYIAGDSWSHALGGAVIMIRPLTVLTTALIFVNAIASFYLLKNLVDTKA